MKAPVGLLSGRAVCVSRWRGFAPTSSAERSKRIFTGGVVEGNGSCRAVFCESAALRGNLRQALNRLNSLSQNLTVLPAPSEREPLAWREIFQLKCKVCGRTRSPLGELSRSD